MYVCVYLYVYVYICILIFVCFGVMVLPVQHDTDEIYMGVRNLFLISNSFRDTLSLMSMQSRGPKTTLPSFLNTALALAWCPSLTSHTQSVWLARSQGEGGRWRGSENTTSFFDSICTHIHSRLQKPPAAEGAVGIL